MTYISIRGAKTHNLQNVDIDLPREKLVVLTGPSGSGKSSLAFDTVFAQGQRNYVESLSVSARQFIAQMPRPDVDSISGLTPTIAIEQHRATGGPRSTVGTATELHDFLRVLFARAGVPHCPTCHVPIEPLTVGQMVDHIQARFAMGTRFNILAPLIRGQKGNLKSIFARLQRDGYVRIRIDGQLHLIGEPISINPGTPHDLDIYIDRLIMSPDMGNRLADSLELALGESDGLVIIAPTDGEPVTYTDRLACASCGTAAPTLRPSDFSFNSPRGACPTCMGMGEEKFFDEYLIVPDSSLSIRDGAIAPWSRRNTPYYRQMLDAVTTKYGIDPFKPWQKLSKRHQDILINGTSDEIDFTVKKGSTSSRYQKTFEGVRANLARRAAEYEKKQREKGQFSDYLADEFGRYMSCRTCSSCNGARLKTSSLHVFIDKQNIAQLLDMSIEDLIAFFDTLSLSERQQRIAEPIIGEVRTRLLFLRKVGLSYLQLSRSMATISGGESQRIRLANQLGSSLTGVTYILDEPSIGLHPRDHDRLLNILKELKDRGNSIIVVEHDADTMRMADYLVDMGPGAGINGGRIIAKGTVEEVMRTPASITGRFLSGNARIRRKRQTTPATGHIIITDAGIHNLKKIKVQIPLGQLVAVTGVSGSGKSSLVMDTLLPAARLALRRESVATGTLQCQIKGIRRNLDKIVAIDQSPIGKSPRSNPATFTGLLGDIRELFAALPTAKQRGYKKGRFSFNVKGGRCEACQGDGLIRVEMNFLPDAFVTCEVCNGKRYNRETLEIQYRGKNIADILALTSTEAYDFLENHAKVRQKLFALREVGLGYISLGQSANTLSGGEAQRLKLAKELSGAATGRTLYVMDEPTTGLHFEDVRSLIEMMDRLVADGNSIVLIEHNLDVIKCADWIIDIGPEGGDEGGRVVAEGTPEQIARTDTATGKVLQRVMG
ncbi:MAG: excinuclease ABC subunit UvrA [Deltaproteobacteria bacterium]|nr:excinuclease ABC subunit UvrA [Deltaproteobacteria bacterium]